MLDRKDRKNGVCPLTPSTSASDSSPIPSSSEDVEEGYGSKSLEEGYGSKSPPSSSFMGELEEGYGSTAKDVYGSKTSPGYVTTAKLPQDDYSSKTTSCREGFSSSFNRKSHQPPKKYLPTLHFHKLG